MNEAILKADLVDVLRLLPKAVVFRHEDKFTMGIPDISITWFGFTSWIEVKYANPEVEGTGIQLVTAMALAREGRCYYVIYEQINGFKATYIASPRAVQEKQKPDGRMATGFDHKFVARFIRSEHVNARKRPV